MKRKKRKLPKDFVLNNREEVNRLKRPSPDRSSKESDEIIEKEQNQASSYS